MQRRTSDQQILERDAYTAGRLLAFDLSRELRDFESAHTRPGRDTVHQRKRGGDHGPRRSSLDKFRGSAQRRLPRRVRIRSPPALPECALGFGQLWNRRAPLQLRCSNRESVPCRKITKLSGVNDLPKIAGEFRVHGRFGAGLPGMSLGQCNRFGEEPLAGSFRGSAPRPPGWHCARSRPRRHS
jgi:hypothetical protein